MAILELKIPKAAAGRPLTEMRIKDGLRKLNRDIFFDVGGRLGMDHPYIQYRQGVYYDGRPEGRKHICSMDRGGPLGGIIVEVPVWSTITDLVEVPLADAIFTESIVMPCMHNPDNCMVQKQVRNDVILCGWRHTFDKLIAARIPGITRRTLEGEFGISLQDYVEPVEIPEEGGTPWDDVDDDDGKTLDEMGLYEARPTIILDGS